MTSFGEVLAGLSSSGGDGSYAVAELPSAPSYLAGRSSIGRPALLVRTGDEAVLMPLRLAGVEVKYSVRCRVAEGGAERIERLSIIECLSADPEVISFFSDCMQRLVAILGPAPAVASLSAAVDRLVAMFRALALPPANDVIGLIGELCVIYAAADSRAAVRAWHADPNERYDFVLGNMRMDAKATASAQRVHTMSADQASPPKGTIGVLASVMVRRAGGGTSVAELIDRITDRLSPDAGAVFRLHEILALTLRSAMDSALEHRFDLEEALSSLQFYDLRQLPGLRPPFPERVSDVRYGLDLGGLEAPCLPEFRARLSKNGRGVLPNRGSRVCRQKM